MHLDKCLGFVTCCHGCEELSSSEVFKYEVEYIVDHPNSGDILPPFCFCTSKVLLLESSYFIACFNADDIQHEQ